MHWLLKREHWWVSLTALLLAEPCLSSTKQETLNYQGLERSYYLHVPENLKQGASLVVVLHGYTSSATTIMSYSGMNEVADADPSDGSHIVFERYRNKTSTLVANP